VAQTILQSDLAVNFIYPFLLIFFIVFAILEKTKVLGEGKKQINAMVAFIIGLIFIAAVQPKIIVGDLILYLSIAMVLMFVILILWGFASGGELKNGDILGSKGLKVFVAVVIILGAFVVLSLSAGIDLGGFFGKLFDFLFDSSWSSKIWSNLLFLALIGIALAVAIKSSGASGGSGSS
jgi:hypothetical protein